MAYLPKRENLILSKPGCHHGIRTLTYLEAKKPSEGEQETKKVKIATTLGPEKKRNSLTKGGQKMTNPPVRTAASDSSQNSLFRPLTSSHVRT